MLILVLFNCIMNTESFKILVFSPTISRSHMISNGRIADQLAIAGHDVVLLEPDFLNIFHIVSSAKVARRWPVFGFSSVLHDVLQGFSGSAFKDISLHDEHQGLLTYTRAYNKLCEDLINRKTLMDELRAEKFDGYFGEQINLCGNGLAYALGIKSHFWVSSCSIGDPMAWILGMPQPPSYIPSLVGMDITHRPSYFERVRNIWASLIYIYYSHMGAVETTEVFRRTFGNSFPSVEEIAGDSDLIFVATDEFVEFPRPTLPNVIHIGGLGIHDASAEKGMNEVFAKQMEMGSQGVIYFSLGSLVNTSSLPDFAMRAVVDMVKQTPDFHFIIVADKHDQHTRNLCNNLSNVFICHWAPQTAILDHPRLRAFVTHAGYNSIMEASRSGVPLLMVPFMFDQMRNARAVELNGWGIPLSRFALRDRPDELYRSLHRLLNDTKYKHAAVRISTLIRTKPFNATEKLVKFTEYVLANGGMKELLTEGRRLSFVKYYNLDIFVPFGMVVAALIWSSYRLLFIFVYGKCLSKKEKLQ